MPIIIIFFFWVIRITCLHELPMKRRFGLMVMLDSRQFDLWIGNELYCLRQFDIVLSQDVVKRKLLELLIDLDLSHQVLFILLPLLLLVIQVSNLVYRWVRLVIVLESEKMVLAEKQKVNGWQSVELTRQHCHNRIIHWLLLYDVGVAKHIPRLQFI